MTMLDTCIASCITWRRDGAGYIAMLGAVEVGVASPLYADGKPFGAQWRCDLPNLRTSPRPAHDMPQAQAQLHDAIMNWIDAAALAPAVSQASPIRAFREAKA